MKKNTETQSQMVLYQAKNGAVELRGDFTNDTVWATQAQIAEVFEIERSVVTKHIGNILKSGEISEKSNVQKMHIANSDKPVSLYSLDIILSIGYRANSERAIGFRKWATSVLKNHIIQGYTINPARITANYDAFLSAVADVQKLLPVGNMISASSILELVKSFAGTWFSLECYDESRLPTTGATKKSVTLQSTDLYKAIAVFKAELMKKGEASDLFASEKKQGSLEGIVGNVMQSAFGSDMYQTIEEKAAHLLYFIVKNHVFNDGNKRSGAFAFVWFLRRTKLATRHKITPETLTVITLLVAESNPNDKDRIIGIILMLLR
jgi:prophage maintenance system killer protein/prophage antirepressor-like protein